MQEPEAEHVTSEGCIKRDSAFVTTQLNLNHMAYVAVTTPWLISMQHRR